MTISKIYPNDKRSLKLIDELLSKEQIRKDSNLDYTCAMFDDDMNIIATGSCFKNTLRCLAVDNSHQGEGFMNQIVTHLVDYEFSRGLTHLFLYTKNKSMKFFKDLGFFEIVNIENQIVFMENKRTGFSDYLDNLKKDLKPGKNIASLIMNANPFTLGHQYLVETAASQSSHLYVFVVSEDRSFFHTNDRMEMVKRGVSHLPNVTVLPTRDYMVSSATFPSYFLKEKADLEVAKVQATLDATLFLENIVPTLQLTKRFVGQEPLSPVTSVYNDALRAAFGSDLELVIIDRLSVREEVVSATRVRAAIQDKNVDELKQLVPATTYHYLEEKHFIG